MTHISKIHISNISTNTKCIFTTIHFQQQIHHQYFHPTTTTAIMLYFMSQLICILSVLINVLFCFAVYKRPRLHNLSMILLVNFYITGTTICLFASFIISFPGHPVGSSNTPNAFWSFAAVGPFTNIIAIAIERYFATNRPDFYKRNRTPCKMGLIVSIIWIYSVGLAAIMASKIVQRCNRSIGYAFVGFNVVPSSTIVFTLYYLIRRRVRWLRECAHISTETTPLVNEMEEREKAFTDSIMKVGVIVFALWVIILVYTSLNDKCVIKIIYLLNTCLPLSCLLNSIPFSYGNWEFRKYLKYQCCDP